MRIVLKPQAEQDLAYWKKSGRKDVMKRIFQLLADITEHPATGIGKSEALRHQLSGWWSRRITAEHRLVYTVEDDTIIVAQCRYHY